MNFYLFNSISGKSVAKTLLCKGVVRKLFSCVDGMVWNYMTEYEQKLSSKMCDIQTNNDVLIQIMCEN